MDGKSSRVDSSQADFGFWRTSHALSRVLLSLVILKEVLLLLSLCWHPPVLHLSSLLMLQLVPVLPGVSDQPGINRGALASIILSLMLRALVLLIVTVTSAGIWEALT